MYLQALFVKCIRTFKTSAIVRLALTTSSSRVMLMKMSLLGKVTLCSEKDIFAHNIFYCTYNIQQMKRKFEKTFSRCIPVTAGANVLFQNLVIQSFRYPAKKCD